MKHPFLLFSLLTFSLAACTDEKKPSATTTAPIETASKEPTPTISDHNGGRSSAENGQRPTKSTIEDATYPTAHLFGIWTLDPKGPHADFELTAKSFYVVDYDGNGDMPYVIKQDSLTIYYEDYTGKGKIEAAASDTLIITWDDGKEPLIYTRWKG